MLIFNVDSKPITLLKGIMMIDRRLCEIEFRCQPLLILIMNNSPIQILNRKGRSITWLGFRTGINNMSIDWMEDRQTIISNRIYMPTIVNVTHEQVTTTKT